MTQCELECAVVRATGDSLPEVQRLGFQLADLFPEQIEDPAEDDCLYEAFYFDDGPLVFDWDDRTVMTLEEYLSAVR